MLLVVSGSDIDPQGSQVLLLADLLSFVAFYLGVAVTMSWNVVKGTHLDISSQNLSFKWCLVGLDSLIVKLE